MKKLLLAVLALVPAACYSMQQAQAAPQQAVKADPQYKLSELIGLLFEEGGDSRLAALKLIDKIVSEKRIIAFKDISFKRACEIVRDSAALEGSPVKVLGRQISQKIQAIEQENARKIIKEKVIMAEQLIARL